MTLRVRDWDQHYENNRTRGMKRTAWLPVPNKQHNLGYVTLVSHSDGAAHFGAWIAMLQIASRCDQRGLLARSDGKPHTANSMALISRLPEAVFDAVIPRLVDIGWIEILENTQGPAGIPHRTAMVAHPSGAGLRSIDEEGNKNGIEKEQEHTCAFEKARVDENSFQLLSENQTHPEKKPDPRLAWFDLFWAEYLPLRQKAKKDAYKAFMQIVKAESTFTAIMAGLKAQAPEMLARDADKRPFAATWLRGSRWEDSPDETTQAKRTALDSALDQMYEKKGNA